MKKFLPLLTLIILALPALAEADNLLHAKNPFDLNCAANILMDSTNNPAGGLLLTAEGTGDAPFTYLWSNGETSQSITFFQWGTNFCVTITDATGCEAIDCLFSTIVCSVTIAGSNTGVLTASPTGTGPFTYTWSNGQTGSSITPNAFGNYCVTVVDAIGCSTSACYQYNGGTGNCVVQIFPDSTATGGLSVIAQANGQPPFTYDWNTGENTQSINISPNIATYCVVITDASGCEASDCFTITNPAVCGVQIEIDSIPGANDLQLTANASGQAPFSYQWNVQNWQTQSITIPPSGSNSNTFCVIVTDATGCTATDCVTLDSTFCSVDISETIDPVTGEVILTAATPNAGPYIYTWNTGELTQSISPQPANADTYCVTVTNANGCSASDCFTFLNPNVSQVQGYVYVPDSTSTPVMLEGLVELYLLDPANNLFSLFAITTLQNFPNGWYSYYDFGQVTAGTYLIKVSLDTNSPYFEDYLPTYYGDVVEWNEATEVIVPSSQSFYQITLVEDQNLTGTGGINGLVDDGEGFAPHDDDRSGPVAGISILLFDDQEEPLTHTLTDGEGKYSFENLPYGTYKISVEITGVEQGVRWVTLSPENPVSGGNDFEVGENGIVNGNAELATEGGLQVFPNPVSSLVHVYLEANAAFDAQITLSGLTGKTALIKKQNITKGSQQIELNLSNLTSGVYFLQINTGRAIISRKVVIK